MISVIIRCHNEEQWIGHAIQSAIDHLDNPEIVIVDHNSSDDSMDVVRMFKHHVQIKEESIDDYSPGRALNLAVSKASYDNILIFSAHCVITKMRQDGSVDLLKKYSSVFGKQIPVYKGRKISKRYIWSNFDNEPITNMRSSVENRNFLHNAFALYKKSTLKRNPFDEVLYGKEDRYWAKQIIEKGGSILYNPEMECIHHWTPNGATWKGIG